MSAGKFLYTVTLAMPWSEEHFPRLKVPQKLPQVLGASKVMQFSGCIGILKHRAVLMLCYGSGLRISEAVSPKVRDIDFKRMLVAVRHGKNACCCCCGSTGRSNVRGGRPYSRQHHPSEMPGGLPDGRHHQACHAAYVAA